MRVKCCDEPELEDCSERCERQLSCGHKCADECRKPCGLMECKELVKLHDERGLCGHDFVNVPCFRKNGYRLEEVLMFCDVPCDTMLKCEHPCMSTCDKCWNGRLHEPCQMKCGSVGICQRRYVYS